MDVGTVLQAAVEQRVRLRVEGSRVRATGTIPPDLVEALQSTKGEIVRRLSGLDAAARRVRAMEDAGRTTTPQYESALYDYLLKLCHYEKAGWDGMRCRGEA